MSEPTQEEIETVFLREVARRGHRMVEIGRLHLGGQNCAGSLTGGHVEPLDDFAPEPGPPTGGTMFVFDDAGFHVEHNAPQQPGLAALTAAFSATRRHFGLPDEAPQCACPQGSPDRSEDA